MINTIKSYYKSTRYILNLVKFNESNIKSIKYQDEYYLGLDQKETTVRVFYSNNKKMKCILLKKSI